MKCNFIQNIVKDFLKINVFTSCFYKNFIFFDGKIFDSLESLLFYLEKSDLYFYILQYFKGYRKKFLKREKDHYKTIQEIYQTHDQLFSFYGKKRKRTAKQYESYKLLEDASLDFFNSSFKLKKGNICYILRNNANQIASIAFGIRPETIHTHLKTSLLTGSKNEINKIYIPNNNKKFFFKMREAEKEGFYPLMPEMDKAVYDMFNLAKNKLHYKEIILKLDTKSEFKRTMPSSIIYSLPFNPLVVFRRDNNWVSEHAVEIVEHFVEHNHKKILNKDLISFTTYNLLKKIKTLPTKDCADKKTKNKISSLKKIINKTLYLYNKTKNILH